MKEIDIMARRVNWEAVKVDYEEHGYSYSELIKKYGMGKATLSERVNKEGWIKAKTERLTEQLASQKVELIQKDKAITEQLSNLPPHAIAAYGSEVDRRLRLAGLISDGIERSQSLANRTLEAADSMGVETADGFKMAIVATDNHSKVTQRNASVVFGTMPNNNDSTPDKMGDIIQRLKQKHA